MKDFRSKIQFYAARGTGLGLVFVLLVGCNLTKNPESIVSDNGASVAGKGAQYSGVGACAGPTGDAVVHRIYNGLGGAVPFTGGNFNSAWKLASGNLPSAADPTVATGQDQNMLVAYSACVDLINKGSSFMQTNYSLTPSTTAGSASAAKSNLISAGLKILDRHTGGLASSAGGTAVNQALTQIVTQSITNGASTDMAFVTVCTAASTAGSTLLGF